MKNSIGIIMPKKILYEEGVRSKSFNSKNNKITRGEFVYMLHRLNEWQY